MFKKLQRFLDSITMYRVVLYALVTLATTTLTLSLFNVLTYSSFSTLLVSLMLLYVICFAVNIALGRIYKISTNHESSLITALILFFVLASPTKTSDWIGLCFAAVVAITSKYVITWRSAHIFNPAAFGILVVSVMGVGNGAWWIANKPMYFPMLIVGAIVLLKIRRFKLFLSFFIPALFIIIAKDSSGASLLDTFSTTLTLYPLLFLGTIMLTEPSTMPSTQNMRLVFGGIVGVILATNINFGFIEASPHLALLLGNLFAFAVSMRAGAYLKLISKTQLTPTTYSFLFKPSRKLKHAAGQYIELTLPGVKFDSRGNRRTFTIASDPQSDSIEVGVKFYKPSSAFKKKFQALKPGQSIMGGHIAGDFTLPKNTTQPVVFVAGGIGITPYIAMIKDSLKKGINRPITLYYFAADNTEVAYKDTLKLAQKAGISIQLRAGSGLRLTNDDVKSHQNAEFYLSGPPGLVAAYKAQLIALKVTHIHTDLFTGY